MEQRELIPHLFRTTAGKISAVLIRFMGITQADEAADITSETFLAALETWPYDGIPVNPEAWLFTVAKNKARNRLKRDQLFISKISPEWQRRQEKIETIEWTEQQILDSQLQLMFALAHPSIPPESQVGLCLRLLCGFGIDEIASAFLTNKETINKRLYRAREKIREEKISMDFPAKEDISDRLDAVLTTIYLLFNEGYYSETQENKLQEDLCAEAMRLLQILLKYPPADQPRVHALYALFCFHASRFGARKNHTGEPVLYDEQDEKLWDQQLITEGALHLRAASTGDQLSSYHLEATIAYWHTQKTDDPGKWEHILQLYDQLLLINASPVVALNRCYALYRAKGAELALPVLQLLNLNNNKSYNLLLKEINSAIGPKNVR